MSRHIGRRFTFATLAVTFIACGGDGSPTGNGGGNVTLEASRAVSDSIGSAGGVITATSSSGITYTLTIPAGALQAPTRITLTPIKDQKNLPTSGGFAAGADFQPAGLQFAQLVRLAATPLPAAPAGMQLIGVTFEGDGDSLGLAPLADSSGTLITFITHFSGTSFVFGTTADLQFLAGQVQTGTASQTFINQLAALGTPTPPGNPAALPILLAWFASVILPELQGAGTDAELLLAVGDYDQWARQGSFYLTGLLPIVSLVPASPLTLPTSLSSEVGQASQAAAPVLRSAISGNNSVCRSQHNLQAMFNVLYWQGYATYFSVDTPNEQLDLATVLAGICTQVVEISDTLASSLQAGFPHTLVVGFGLQAGGAPIPTPVAFSVRVTAIGATIQNPAGNTNAAGFWGGSVVTAQGNGPVVITAQACVLFPGTTTSTGICGTANIFRGSLDLTGLWSGYLNFFPLDVVLSQNQNAITGTYTTVSDPNFGPTSGTISATLSGDSLLNFSLNQVVQRGAPCTGTLAGTPGVTSTQIAGTAAGPACNGQNLSFDFVWARVTTGVSLAGIYFAGPSCGTPAVCAVTVWQFGNTLYLEDDSNGSKVFLVTITGANYAGTGARNTSGVNCLRFNCVFDPALTISGSFTGGTISAAVVDPIGGNYSFSLPKFP